MGPYNHIFTVSTAAAQAQLGGTAGEEATS